ncbi:MAG: hypothetical protein ACRD1N_03065, partial [Terriglobia bacterium]
IGLTIATTIGILLSTLYALRFIQRAFHGPNSNHWQVRDLGPREVVELIPMVVILIWLGIYPQPVFNTFRPAMEKLQEAVGSMEWNGANLNVAAAHRLPREFTRNAHLSPNR